MYILTGIAPVPINPHLFPFLSRGLGLKVLFSGLPSIPVLSQAHKKEAVPSAKTQNSLDFERGEEGASSGLQEESVCVSVSV